MAAYRLYCFAQSGNAYKAALMLNLCGADWAAQFVDFFDGEHQRPGYLEVNEMGEVPVLEHAGRRWSQSGVILDVLAEDFGKFGPAGNDERREILRWLLWDNHKLTSYTATLRYLRSMLKTGETAITELMHTRATAAYRVLDRHLDGRRFVVAERPTIADISICGYLFWPDEIGVSWDDYPNIGTWLERIQALPGWAPATDLMPGKPPPTAG